MVNRLKGMRAYEFGPIDRCPNSGRVWRDRLTPQLREFGVIPVNPLAKPMSGHDEGDVSREERHRQKRAGNFDYVINEKDRRFVDLRLVNTSDFLVGCIDIQAYPCGTYEELFTANAQEKPILVWSPRGKTDIPDWLWWTLPKEFIFNDDEEIIEYLKGIDNGTIDPHYRWVFIDYN